LESREKSARLVVAVRVRRADLPSGNSWSISLLSERQREAKDGEACIGRAARLIRTVRKPQALTKYAHKLSGASVIAQST
jgi:hypothetical protein